METDRCRNTFHFYSLIPVAPGPWDATTYTHTEKFSATMPTAVYKHLWEEHAVPVPKIIISYFGN